MLTWISGMFPKEPPNTREDNERRTAIVPPTEEGQQEQAQTILDEQGDVETPPPPPPVEPPPPPDPPTPLQQFDGAVTGVRESLRAIKTTDAAVEESDNSIEALEAELDTAMVAHAGMVTDQTEAVSGYNASLDGLIDVLNALKR